MKLGIHALHCVARAALRLHTPLRAKHVVETVARWLPPFDKVEVARLAIDELGGRGTCLSRALTIAARLPGAEIVVAVDPAPGARPLGGHAWVEYNGMPLRSFDVAGVEIARLR
jgi:hypothetical protein